jgi:hypothetical protein
MYAIHHADKQRQIHGKHTEPSRYNTIGNGTDIFNNLKPNTQTQMHGITYTE